MAEAMASKSERAVSKGLGLRGEGDCRPRQPLVVLRRGVLGGAFAAMWLALGATLALACASGPVATAQPTALAAAGPAGAEPAVFLQTQPAPAETFPTEAPSSTVEADGERALEHVYELAGNIGSRVAGTARQDQAARYLAASFATMGYEPTLQEFSFSANIDLGSSLTVLDPEPADIRVSTLRLSATGQVEAELERGGRGQPGELRGTAGRVALVERGDLPFAEKVANAARAGAVGVVIYNHEQGAFQGSLGQASTVPTVGISRADGLELVHRLQSGRVRVALSVSGGQGEWSGVNVVATRAGTLPARVVIGGHFDSVPAGPGANDNASGVSVVLELARVLGARPFPYSVTFVAFGAEEWGMFGSKHFVRTLTEAERGEVLAMVNLDMVGVGEAWEVGGSSELVRSGVDILRRTGEQASEMSPRASRSSDQSSFLEAGIPAVFFHRVEDRNYHSAEDKPEHIQAEALEIITRAVLALLDELRLRSVVESRLVHA